MDLEECLLGAVEHDLYRFEGDDVLSFRGCGGTVDEQGCRDLVEGDECPVGGVCEAEVAWPGEHLPAAPVEVDHVNGARGSAVDAMVGQPVPGPEVLEPGAPLQQGEVRRSLPGNNGLAHPQSRL